MERPPEKMSGGTMREKFSLSPGYPENPRRSPLLPIDFASWKLVAPAAGLLGLGVYAGFRKQMEADAEEARSLLRSGGQIIPFSPYRHAARALMYGTALCVGCTTVGVLVIGYGMGVRNLREFGDKARAWAPRQLQRLGVRPRSELLRDQEAVKGMTEDQEWEYIDRLLEEGAPKPNEHDPKAVHPGETARVPR